MYATVNKLFHITILLKNKKERDFSLS